MTEKDRSILYNAIYAIYRKYGVEFIGLDNGAIDRLYNKCEAECESCTALWTQIKDDRSAMRYFIIQTALTQV